MMSDYLEIAKKLIERGDEKELAEVFRLRDLATAAMIRQCCLPDEPSDAEVGEWLETFPANAKFLANGLARTSQKIVRIS